MIVQSVCLTPVSRYGRSFWVGGALKRLPSDGFLGGCKRPSERPEGGIKARTSVYTECYIDSMNKTLKPIQDDGQHQSEKL